MDRRTIENTRSRFGAYVLQARSATPIGFGRRKLRNLLAGLCSKPDSTIVVVEALLDSYEAFDASSMTTSLNEIRLVSRSVSRRQSIDGTR